MAFSETIWLLEGDLMAYSYKNAFIDNLFYRRS